MTARDILEEYPELVNLADDRAACSCWPAPVGADDYLMWITDEIGIQEENVQEEPTLVDYIDHLQGFADKLHGLGVEPSTPPWEIRYKVWVRGVGETSYASNGLDFATVAEAFTYGRELLSRWYGADDFQVLPLAFDPAGFPGQDVIDANAVKEA